MATISRLIVIALACSAAASGAALAQPAAPSAPAQAIAACPAPGASAEPVRFESPTWIRRPDAEDWKSVYPPHALKEQKTDETTIDCDVADDGHLQNCRLVSDNKPGMGFDKAAFAVAKMYRMAPLSSLQGYASLPECLRKSGPPHVLVPMHWHP